MNRIILMMLLAVVSNSAMAESCMEETLETISADGSLLKMMSGKEYKVNEVDQSHTKLWLATDDVLVCDDKEIINRNEDGEKATVKRLK